MSLVAEFCALLDELDLGVYGVGGNVFHLTLPPSPDTALAVALYAGGESDSANPWDSPNVQVRVRGPATDARVAEQLAQAVYDHIHGLGDRALAGGTWLELAVGNQAGPIFAGVDEQGRAEFTVNFRCDVQRSTPTRV